MENAINTIGVGLKKEPQYKVEGPIGSKVSKTDKDLNKIYVNTQNGLVEYMGGSNFLNGKRKCPHCNSNMERTPIKQEFIRTEGGKILVNIRSNGIAMFSKADPNWNWSCLGCVLSLSPGQS